MLMNPQWSESRESKVVLKETPSCAAEFGKFLTYLYTGRIRINQSSVMPILGLADKYNVKVCFFDSLFFPLLLRLVYTVSFWTTILSNLQLFIVILTFWKLLSLRQEPFDQLMSHIMLFFSDIHFSLYWICYVFSRLIENF